MTPSPSATGETFSSDGLEAAAPTDSDAGAEAGRQQRLRTVDFSRPTKFTADHQRRIRRAIDTFCQTAVTRLSAELRWPIEMEAVNTLQVTWSAAQSQLPPGSLSTTLEVHPIQTRMLLTLEQSFVLMALECLLGGAPLSPSRERRFSEIDWALTRRLMDSIAHQMSTVWEDLGGVTLSAGEIESHHDGSPVASVSEPTYVVVIEIRLNKQSSRLELLIPWIAIEPVAARIAGRERPRRANDSDDGSAIETALSHAPVTLRAEVAAVDIAVQEILALEPGRVVALGAKAAQGVSVYAEHVRVARAKPGANGPRRAVQITDSELTVEAVSQRDGDVATGAGVPAEVFSTLGVEDALSSTKLRVWAELGRARMALGSALQLPPGAVVDLDCAPDDPIDLFVNGIRFAQGHLLVTDDGEWAIVIDELGGRRPAAEPAELVAALPEPPTQGAAN